MSAPIGPKKDYFSQLPEDIKIIIGQMSPELLLTGQKTNKAISKLLERNDVWLNIAKKMDITIPGTDEAKRHLMFEVFFLNSLFETYFPNVPKKKSNPFARNLEFHAYISAHTKDLSIEAFSKLMDDFSKGKTLENTALNAVKAFIKEGVLNNKSLPWDKILMQALGQRFHGGMRDSHVSDPMHPPEVFNLLLQAYMKTNPVIDEKQFQELWNIIYMQRNLPSMVSFFSHGPKVDEGHLTDFLKYWQYFADFNLLNLELSLRFLAEKFGDKKRLTEMIDIYSAIKIYREIIDGKPILRHLADSNFKRDLIEHLSPSDPYFQLLIKYLTIEEKGQLLQLVDEIEKQQHTQIAKMNAADPQAVLKEQKANHNRFDQIKKMLA